LTLNKLHTKQKPTDGIFFSFALNAKDIAHIFPQIHAYSFYKHKRGFEFGTDKRKSSGIPKTNPDGGHGAERDLNSEPFTWNSE